MSRVLPILFNTDMVRAILDGRKTVTRRVCKDGNEFTVPDMSFYDADKRTFAVHNYADKEHADKLSLAERTCLICPGDILYVRETWKIVDYLDRLSLKFEYEADGKISNFIDFANDRLQMFLKYIGKKGWCPALFMPKEAARIWIKVTDVRVERLQEITEEQIRKEGFIPEVQGHFKFKWTWNSTIKKPDIARYGWDANPWVWVIEFERCEKPEPCILKDIEPAEDKRPCIGYSLSENDDEPCEMCKGCSKCSGNDMEE